MSDIMLNYIVRQVNKTIKIFVLTKPKALEKTETKQIITST